MHDGDEAPRIAPLIALDRALVAEPETVLDERLPALDRPVFAPRSWGPPPPISLEGTTLFPPSTLSAEDDAILVSLSPTPQRYHHPAYRRPRHRIDPRVTVGLLLALGFLLGVVFVVLV